VGGVSQTLYIVTYLRAPLREWPVDVGDDPSFMASAKARQRGGVLTWGVCRQDVRNALRRGDLVVFFAADRFRDRRPARYSFVAFGTVDQKVSQTEIWTTSSLEVYRSHANLLIRPADGGFEHHEPGMPPKQWHRDWLWRIVETQSLRKPGVLEASEPGRFRLGMRIGGRPLRVASNYILFRSEPSTMVLAQPPVVAEASVAGSPETWRSEPFARELHELLFSSGVRQCLRTSNRQQPHRHITVHGVDSESVRHELAQLCARHGLQGGGYPPADVASTGCR
jgi:hypothetical protein